MQGKNTGYKKVRDQNIKIDDAGFNESPNNFDMSSPATQQTSQLESDSKIKKKAFAESGSSITKTKIVDDRRNIIK
jgi:hypothetical protein